MSLILDEHREYLADRHRLAVFQTAIERQVRPGDVVLDLGSGTGILGLLACRAGAARVYAIDDGGIAGIAREIAAANGYADRVTVVRGHSMRVALPERVDVVVTDQIGRFGFEAGFLEYVADARRRFLKPEGRTVPVTIAQRLCPAEAPDIRRRIDFWRSGPAGFDFSAVAQPAASTGYPEALPVDRLLADPQAGGTLDPVVAAAGLDTRHEFVIRRAGRVDVIAGWFVATLAPGVLMTNGPDAPDRINRRQVMFPLAQSVDVDEGDLVRLRMRVRPLDVVVAWDVEVVSKGTGRTLGRTRASTVGGMLLSHEDLAQTRLDRRPRLTAAGRARQSVLELADGTRTLQEIEQIVYERHPDVVDTLEDAAVFVAEVVTRYGE
ncbi:MAG: 50S ribosomal protein L11 methyltransferase [Acidobacteriota bacterium]